VPRVAAQKSDRVSERAEDFFYIGAEAFEFERRDNAAQSEGRERPTAFRSTDLATLREFLQLEKVVDRSALFPHEGGSYDYAHLGQSFAEDAYYLSTDLFERALRLNHMVVDASRPLLFGIRGAALIERAAQREVIKSERIEIREARYDHLNYRCVMGICDLQTKRIVAFRASTVPDLAYMYATARRGTASNMLPTGMHERYVGMHNKWLPKALLHLKGMPVVRMSQRGPRAPQDINKSRIRFDLSSDWCSNDPRICYLPGATARYIPFENSVGDNIHAAKFDVDEPSENSPFFSSAGCQVVPGDFVQGRHVRIWGQFHNELKLQAELDGARFQYLLLTGRELRTLSKAPAQSEGSMKRLRFGSRGEVVRKFQRSLASQFSRFSVRESGEFDGRTMSATILWQRQIGILSDGIVTPDQALRLQLSL
jgi:hypothetical protein